MAKLDVLRCPCGGTLRMVALVAEPEPVACSKVDGVEACTSMSTLASDGLAR